MAVEMGPVGVEMGPVGRKGVARGSKRLSRWTGTDGMACDERRCPVTSYMFVLLLRIIATADSHVLK